MAEQYNSSHTGAIIDEKIQSLIDFGNIYEGHLSPGLLYENEQHQESIIDNRGDPTPGGGYTYEFDYDENYNTTRYSVHPRSPRQRHAPNACHRRWVV